MKYMSLDLETTGLEPTIHGITEFAVVFADDALPGLAEQTFYRWLNPEGYVWSVYCLQLHANWIERVTARIATKQFGSTDSEPKICKNLVELAEDFLHWYKQVDEASYEEFQKKGRGNITGTGKNFGTFDLQFLKAWLFPNVMRHRTLDWVPYYTLPSDKVPPDLKLCKERGILMGCPDLKADVAHNALEDALDVHKLIQFAAKHNRQTLTSDPRM